jgi:hypothetical protein
LTDECSALAIDGMRSEQTATSARTPSRAFGLGPLVVVMV